VTFYNPDGSLNPTPTLPSQFQVFVQPDIEFGEVQVRSTTNTLVTYFIPPSTRGPAAFSFYVPAENASVLVCPQWDACVGSIELPFYAAFGSVRGRVVRSDGTPVGAGFTVAAYRLDQPANPQRAVVTDSQGNFSFTLTDARPLINENHLFPIAVLSGVNIAPGNNWGLPVDPTDGGPGRRPYALAAGSGTPSFNTVGQRIAKLQSSRAADMTLVVDLPADGCPIAPLSAITDPDALDFEANDQVFRTHDRTGQSRMAPGMLPLTGSPMQGRIACLQAGIASLGGHWVPESAWRPAAYQAHLREILDRFDDLKKLAATPVALP
jgi:hypothetical protein